MAWIEDQAMNVVEVGDETLTIERGRGQRDLEQPGVPVDGNARPSVPTNVVREVNVDAARDLVHVTELR
jgi:hypothetical protein